MCKKVLTSGKKQKETRSRQGTPPQVSHKPLNNPPPSWARPLYFFFLSFFYNLPKNSCVGGIRNSNYRPLGIIPHTVTTTKAHLWSLILLVSSLSVFLFGLFLRLFFFFSICINSWIFFKPMNFSKLVNL